MDPERLKQIERHLSTLDHYQRSHVGHDYSFTACNSATAIRGLLGEIECLKQQLDKTKEASE